MNSKVELINYISQYSKTPIGRLWSKNIESLKRLYRKIKERNYNPNNLYDVIEKLVEALNESTQYVLLCGGRK